MPSYIDADLLKCAALAVDKDTFTFDEVIALIDAVKPADVQEVKRSEWSEEYDENAPIFMKRRWVCSACGDFQTYGETPYCPYCGAKMDGEKEEEE